MDSHLLLSLHILLSLIEEWVMAAIPAVGFAVLFNVPRFGLLYCALLGGTAHVIRTLLMSGSMDVVLATFITSVLVGYLGVIIAKKMRSHPKVFTIAAIIPMFPGLPAYRAMISVIETYNSGFSQVLAEQMSASFLQLGFQLGAIVVGLSLPRLLFKNNRPVV